MDSSKVISDWHFLSGSDPNLRGRLKWHWFDPEVSSTQGII